jgi:hypothetical protein
MSNIIESKGVLMNEKGEETFPKTGDFALVNPEGLTQAIPMRSTSAATGGLT